MIIVMHKSNIAKFSERITGQKLTPDSNSYVMSLAKSNKL